AHTRSGTCPQRLLHQPNAVGANRTGPYGGIGGCANVPCGRRPALTPEPLSIELPPAESLAQPAEGLELPLGLILELERKNIPRNECHLAPCKGSDKLSDPVGGGHH